MITISRSTYSLLDWLGDVGGLFDALNIIAEFMIAPIASYALRQRLTSLLVRETETETAEKKSSVSWLAEWVGKRKRK